MRAPSSIGADGIETGYRAAGLLARMTAPKARALSLPACRMTCCSAALFVTRSPSTRGRACRVAAPRSELRKARKTWTRAALRLGGREG